MAITNGKRATYKDCLDLGGHAPSNILLLETQCVTATAAKATGVTVTSGYADNQLVCINDISMSGGTVTPPSRYTNVEIAILDDIFWSGNIVNEADFFAYRYTPSSIVVDQNPGYYKLISYTLMNHLLAICNPDQTDWALYFVKETPWNALLKQNKSVLEMLDDNSAVGLVFKPTRPYCKIGIYPGQPNADYFGYYNEYSENIYIELSGTFVTTSDEWFRLGTSNYYQMEYINGIYRLVRKI